MFLNEKIGINLKIFVFLIILAKLGAKINRMHAQGSIRLQYYQKLSNYIHDGTK